MKEKVNENLPGRATREPKTCYKTIYNLINMIKIHHINTVCG